MTSPSFILRCGLEHKKANILIVTRLWTATAEPAMCSMPFRMEYLRMFGVSWCWFLIVPNRAGNWVYLSPEHHRFSSLRQRSDKPDLIITFIYLLQCVDGRYISQHNYIDIQVLVTIIHLPGDCELPDALSNNQPKPKRM